MSRAKKKKDPFDNELVNRLNIELSKLYHNARTSGDLTTESKAEEKAFAEQFSIESRAAIEQLQEDDLFKDFPFSTRIYQYGRSGATLAPDGLVTTQGGSRFRVSTVLDLEREYNMSNRDMGKLVTALQEFNKRVRDWCSTAPDECLKHLREGRKADAVKRGEFFYTESNDGETYTVKEIPGDVLADVPKYLPDAEKLAALFSAAPELLECVEIVEAAYSDLISKDTLTLMREAIIKAKGLNAG